MRLSILICSLKSRSVQLNRLLDQLGPQQTPDVEIKVLADAGELTVGAKRQRLLEQAEADYVCFIDDDDCISQRYVEGLLEAIETTLPDCVSMQGVRRQDGKPPTAMLMSRNQRRQGVLNRPINHLCPVERSLATATGFADMDCGEDCDYADRLSPLLSTEAYANPGLVQYIYNFDAAKSATWQPAIYANRFGGAFDITLELESPVDWQWQLLLPAPLHVSQCRHEAGEWCRAMQDNTSAGALCKLRIRKELPDSAVEVWVNGDDYDRRVWRTNAGEGQMGHIRLTSVQWKAIKLKTVDCSVGGKPALIRYTRHGI